MSTILIPEIEFIPPNKENEYAEIKLQRYTHSMSILDLQSLIDSEKKGVYQINGVYIQMNPNKNNAIVYLGNSQPAKISMLWVQTLIDQIKNHIASQ